MWYYKWLCNYEQRRHVFFNIYQMHAITFLDLSIYHLSIYHLSIYHLYHLSIYHRSNIYRSIYRSISIISMTTLSTFDPESISFHSAVYRRQTQWWSYIIYFRISLGRDKNEWGKWSLLLISWCAPDKVRYQSLKFDCKCYITPFSSCLITIWSC